MGLRQNNRFRWAVVAVLVGALIGAAAMFVVHARSAAADTAHKEAAVRRAMPIIKLALEASLSQWSSAAQTAHLTREANLGEGNRVYTFWSNPFPPNQFGHDFTWQGTDYRWPTNPFTNRPMTEGTGPGDLSFTLTWWGNLSGAPDAFTVMGRGGDGKPIITLHYSTATPGF